MQSTAPADRKSPRPGDPDFVFDLQSAEYDRDPYPLLRALRERAPIFWWPESQAWYLTRHADVVAVLGDDATYTADRRHWNHYNAPSEAELAHPVVRLQASNILSLEGREHTRVRKLASMALTRRAVRNLEPLMRDLADELIDAFVERGSCDFVRDFAWSYPVMIVSRLLGIEPNSERERSFRVLADLDGVTFSPMVSREERQRALDQMAIHLEAVRALMEEKRGKPGDDLMTDLIRAEAEGERFESDEIIALILSIIAAGGATTAQSFGLGLIELLRHPEQLALFRDDPSVRLDASHEIARYQMPGRFSARYARHATRLGEHALEPGQMVICSVAAAQRDPALVDDPERFDIRRKPADTSVFGVGRHFCIGAQLARLELATGFAHVLERLRGVRLDGDFDAIPYGGNPAVRGPLGLPLRFEPGRRIRAH
ncbi:MAG: cytochrome P450 [Deltaproteobacteria bacterium]|nr:cytochrome P450 [Deltaproteobacteria bacterium]